MVLPSSPAWRYRQAQALLGTSRGQAADDGVRTALRYLRYCQRSGRHPCPAMPVFSAAHDVYTHRPELAEAIAIGVLAGLPVESIAARTGLSEAVIATFEMVFCDVRPYRGFPDYITSVVIGGTAEAERSPAQARQWLAYRRGAGAVDGLLGAAPGIPSAAERWVDSGDPLAVVGAVLDRLQGGPRRPQRLADVVAARRGQRDLLAAATGAAIAAPAHVARGTPYCRVQRSACAACSRCCARPGPSRRRQIDLPVIRSLPSTKKWRSPSIRISAPTWRGASCPRTCQPCRARQRASRR